MNVMNLQAAVGAPVDGVWGLATWTALFAKSGAPHAIAEEFALAAAVWCPANGITDNPLRLAHFLAQLGHESDSYRAMEEYASGAEYEGRADLGNTQPGDGKLFKGRGPIQGTGRANYRVYGRAMGIDLERHPQLLATPSIGLWFACLYWQKRGLNAFADSNDIETITRRINGGLNGFADRKARFATIKEWLV